MYPGTSLLFLITAGLISRISAWIEYSFTIILGLLYSRDSDLEVFSHNPSHGSFTTLVAQLTVFTNYVNKLFL